MTREELLDHIEDGLRQRGLLERESDPEHNVAGFRVVDVEGVTYIIEVRVAPEEDR